MGLDALSILVGILGAIVTVATYFIKKKKDKKEDQDALGVVEAQEVDAGMDRVDAIDAGRVPKQPKQEGPN